MGAAVGRRLSALTWLMLLASVGLGCRGTSVQPEAPVGLSVPGEKVAAQCFEFGRSMGKAADYQEGEERTICSLPVTADDDRTVRANVIAARDGPDLVLTLNIEDQDAQGSVRRLWSRTSVPLARGQVAEIFGSVVTFVPDGDTAGQVMLGYARCGASCGGSGIVIVRVTQGRAQVVREAEGGKYPMALPVGRFVVWSYDKPPDAMFRPQGAVVSLYEWTGQTYRLTETVLQQAY